MPAHPSTIASDASSMSARAISDESFPRAPEPGSSSERTGTSQARTRAQRRSRPYLARFASIGAIERDKVVTTLNLWATSEAR